MKLTETDKQDLIRRAKAEYLKTWRQKNRSHVTEYHRNWCKANPDKVKAYAERYWLNKALQQSE